MDYEISDISKLEKRLRSVAIKQYMSENGYTRAVCFSCGNALQALREAGVDVVGVAPNGELTPNHWFTPAEVRRTFAGLFDATSGHLPMDLMYNIADRLRKAYPLEMYGRTYIASGSGESALVLKLAYPTRDIIAVFNNSDPATEWNERNHLNRLLCAVCNDIIIKEK